APIRTQREELGRIYGYLWHCRPPCVGTTLRLGVRGAGLIDEPVDEKAASAYARRVGERLRAIRKQKGLSLQEVEADSTQEFKASVLGAYERGERSISVPRLQRLARYYNVPVDQLLPRDIDIDLTEGEAPAPIGDGDTMARRPSEAT